MGRFSYEGDAKVDIDDRALAHLQVVIGQKLRRGEPFYFTWRNDASLGEGRTTVWLHPQASLVFKFHGSRQPSLNRAWLEALSHTANSGSGLYVVPEPAVSATGEVILG
ncbi:ATP-dependent DNA ligase [Microbacterium sp.]|uniref:DUF7882 family protein n=1 Tax=Microbacterium sp. TaxID=51671 RepID=UPI0025E0A1AD|nr:ATP-dependent DNA ligase [Microbacterium sp.]